MNVSTKKTVAASFSDLSKRVLLGTVLSASSAVALRAAEPARPNILWVVSEDNGCFLGAYGDPLAQTPTLDKLAEEGVLYERCFAQPVCAPARFTLITGMYAATAGPAQHMRASGKIPAWLEGFPERLRAAGYYTSNNVKTDYNAPININAAWDAASDTADWRGAQPGQPFFSVFNYEVTHEHMVFPDYVPKFDFLRTNPAAVRIPPYQPDTPEMRQDWANYYDEMRLLDGQIAAKLRELEKDGLADNTIVFYYADNGGVLPRSKRFLQESGTRVPLIVYYPPRWRHLAPAAPGSRLTDPVDFSDFAPTVLSLAGVKIPDYMQGRPFAGPARTGPNEFVFTTRDRMDERYDMMRSVVDTRWLYIRNFRPDLPYMQPLDYQFRALGYQSWARLAAEGKLTPATAQFWGEKPSEELYDMEADPDNVDNLAGSAAHAAIVEKMRARLRQRMVKICDNGLLPEGSVLEGYDASHQPGAWPVGRVFDLAILASQRDADNLPAFIQGLADKSEPIRWWAARGCTMLGAKAAPAEAALRERLHDKSGAVVVAAAEALARLGRTDLALPALEKQLMANDTPGFIMQAANVLDRLGEAARPALPEMKRALALAPSVPGGHYPPQQAVAHAIAVLEGTTAPFAYPPVKSAAAASALQ